MKDKSKMKLWAHRGKHGNPILENTILAFKHALAEGAYGLEMDVRVCGSGELVVFHDDSLVRVANRKGYISKMNLTEIKAKVPFVQTLRKVLKTFKGKTKIILDLKGASLFQNDLERKVVDAIVKSDCIKDVIVASTSMISLLKIQVLNPEVQTAFVIKKKWQLLLRKISNTPIHINESLITPVLAAKCKSESFKIRAWVVNDLNRALELEAIGINDIITDNLIPISITS